MYHQSALAVGAELIISFKSVGLGYAYNLCSTLTFLDRYLRNRALDFWDVQSDGLQLNIWSKDDARFTQLVSITSHKDKLEWLGHAWMIRDGCLITEPRSTDRLLGFGALFDLFESFATSRSPSAPPHTFPLTT
jgi:hypothetical protein